jgi:preprotein translocase subunit YajC
MGPGVAYAMGAPGGGGSQGFTAFIPIILIFVIFYFLLIRPQQKRAKEHRALLSNLKVGDQVLTTGGIYGRVTGLRDDIITVEISDKVRVKINRGHVGTILKQDVMKTE